MNNKELEIRDVVKEYLKQNDLSARYMSRKTGIDRTTMQLWLNGQRDLTERNVARVKQFLSGSFITSAQEIAQSMMQEMQEGESING